MHLLQMFNQQPFGTICDNASANFTFTFKPNLCPFFVLLSQIRWTRGCQWLRNLVDFKFRITTKKYQKKNHYIVIKKSLTLKPYTLPCRNPTLAKCGGEAQHLEKARIWSPLGLPNVQSSTARGKTPRIGVFLVSLKRS
jgi:hypothetical protein